MTSLLAMSGFQWLMALALFAVCVFLMLIILVQKGRGGGLASAFGGGGGGSSAFGSKTGDVFTGITVVLAFVYLLLTVFGNYVFKPPTGPPVRPGARQIPAAPASGGPTAPTGTTPSVPPPGRSVPAETETPVTSTPPETDAAASEAEPASAIPNAATPTETDAGAGEGSPVGGDADTEDES